MINQEEVNEDSDSNDADEEDQKVNWSILFVFIFMSVISSCKQNGKIFYEGLVQSVNKT